MPLSLVFVQMCVAEYACAVIELVYVECVEVDAQPYPVAPVARPLVVELHEAQLVYPVAQPVEVVALGVLDAHVTLVHDEGVYYCVVDSRTVYKFRAAHF